MNARLFVIQKRYSPQFWACSTEHGCGWSDEFPKQSFSPSELAKEIRRMMDSGNWEDVVIVQLQLDSGGPRMNRVMEAGRASQEMCGEDMSPRHKSRGADHRADFERVNKD